MNKDIRYNTNLEFRARKIGKKHILMTYGKAYELNNTAFKIYMLVNEKKSVSDIINSFEIDFTVNLEELENDILATLEYLEKIGAIDKT